MAASVVLGAVLGARALAPSTPDASVSASAGATAGTGTGIGAGTATAPRAAADMRAALAVDANGGLTAQGRLRDALEQRVAGAQADQDGVAIGLSFRDRSQQYCRTFSLADALPESGAIPSSDGIACKEAGQWRIANLERAPAAVVPPAATSASSSAQALGAEALGYRAAASAFSPTLLQAVDALRAGNTLDGAAETAAKAGGWRP